MDTLSLMKKFTIVAMALLFSLPALACTTIPNDPKSTDSLTDNVMNEINAAYEHG